jgi:STAS domain
MVELGRRLREVASRLSDRDMDALLAEAGLDPSKEPHLVRPAAAAVADARRFLLLDLRRVTGIDATAASAFAMLRRSLENRGVTMLLTGVAGHEGVRRMLVANGVIAVDGRWEGGRACPAFESMDAALAWCEAHFKKARRPRQPAARLGAAGHPPSLLLRAQAHAGKAALATLQLHTKCSGTSAACVLMRPSTHAAIRPVCTALCCRVSSMAQGTRCRAPRAALDAHALLAMQVAVLHGLVEDLASQVLTLEEVLRMHLEGGALRDAAPDGGADPLPALVASLQQYTHEAVRHTPCAAAPISLIRRMSTVDAARDRGPRVAGASAPACPPWVLWFLVLHLHAPAFVHRSCLHDAACAISGSVLARAFQSAGRPFHRPAAGSLNDESRERARVQELDEGSVIFEPGDPADAIFIVLSGSLISMMDFLRFDECAPAAGCLRVVAPCGMLAPLGGGSCRCIAALLCSLRCQVRSVYLLLQ